MSSNPINLEPYSKKYWEVQKNVRRLPASSSKVKAELFRLLDENDVILLTADTGAGKSTQVPKMVWEYFDYMGMVVCTQPTKVNVINIAKRVSEELDVPLGEWVWYIFQESGKTDKLPALTGGRNKLMFITDGSMINYMLKDPSTMLHYSAFIIDEAHIRNLNIDLLLWFIKRALTIPTIRTKFIIMSATVDKKIFLDYFQDHQIVHYHIEGRPYPVTVNFSPTPIYSKTANPQDEMFEAVKGRIDEIFRQDKKPLGDILVFMYAIKQIKTFQYQLDDFLQERGYNSYRIMGVYSEIFKSPEAEAIVTRPLADGITKIVLATNVAETGITIDGIYYVIDAGLSQQDHYDMITRESCLDTNFISQAEATQRTGRAGRKAPGVCYRLYTEEEYNSFRVSRLTDMEKSNLDRFILSLINYNRHRPGNPIPLTLDMFREFITPPDLEQITKTIDYYRELGLLQIMEEDKAEQLSDLGECVAALQFDVLLSIAFFTSYSYDIEPMIICDLISILSTRYNDWFTAPLPEEFRKHYVNPYGDLIGLYHLYLDFVEEKIPDQYLEYLNLNLFKKLDEIGDKLCDNPTVETYVCTQVKPKYKVREDMFKNIVAALKQVYEQQTIATDDLDMKMIKRGGSSFYNFKTKKVIYLSKINLTTFGENKRSIYGNFLNAELITK